MIWRVIFVLALGLFFTWLPGLRYVLGNYANGPNLFSQKIIMLLIAALACRWRGFSLDDIGIRFPSKQVNWPRLFLVLCGAHIATAFTYAVFDIRTSIETYAITRSAYWSTAFFSIVEEIYYRGWIQAELRRALRREGASESGSVIWINAAFFGFAHASWITQGLPWEAACAMVINTTVLGLVLATYRETSGSLVPSMAAHVVVNLWAELVSSLSSN
jgi:membrane protease YdiL (CAAX protease family)